MSAPGSTDALSALAGGLRVVPGAQPPHALQSTRRDWVGKLAVGKPGSALPVLLGSVFNLCGQAHRLCSQLALHAAAPAWHTAPPNVAERLRTETAQEHIRRVGLDWPRLLSADRSAADAGCVQATLQRCPLLATPAHTDAWPATLAWLGSELFEMPAADWATQWQAGGAAWLAEWASQHNGWLARLVRGARAWDDAIALDPATALPPPVSQADAHSLAAHLRTQTGFAMAPTWQGACAHTGSWTRLGAPQPVAPLTPWGLLGCRLAELARLCLHDPASQSGPGALSFGAMPVGDGQGLAWVEMARGLLVHWVSLQVGQGGTVVHACHVMAPTEWNFHPHGAVAQYIARLDASQPADGLACKVRMLMAAFDPCVPFEVQRPHPLTEMSYA